MRVLIVEPDATAQAAMAAEFAAMRIVTIATGDATGALAALTEQGPSLAVVNYDVEGGGLPLIARLQAAARLRGAALDAFVVVETEPPALKAAAERLHVGAVLVKPVGRKALARALAKLLCRHDLEDAVVCNRNS